MLLLALLLAGCSSVEFTPYEGTQQSWAVAPGALVDKTHYPLPVYRGAPPRRYKVLGEVTLSNVSGFGGSAKTRAAVRGAVIEAQRRGADAVILQERGTDTTGAYVTPIGNSFMASKVTRGHATVIAIKWI